MAVYDINRILVPDALSYIAHIWDEPDFRDLRLFTVSQ